MGDGWVFSFFVFFCIKTIKHEQARDVTINNVVEQDTSDVNKGKRKHGVS